MQFFENQILEWYNFNKRDLPWRKTRDPYKIWLSEIILQQTQVIQGLPYYNKFIRNYPTVKDLAEANLDDVLNNWQGLGYYSRARNMHKTAKTIVDEYGGIFPKEYVHILKLKGIGTYTAAAIASFCFDKPIAVVDGNVFRVLSRVFNIDTPINSTSGKNIFGELAQELISLKDPANYNQGIMELGAVVCKPTNPLCNECPVMEHCEAKSKGIIDKLPVKLKSKPKKQRYFNYICIDDGENTVLEKRTGKDIWHELYQFPLHESDHLITKEEIPSYFNLNGEYEVSNMVEQTHILSHQKINARLYHIKTKSKLKKESVSWKDFDDFPIPRLIEKLLDQLKE